jgi:hypothetical protein
LKIARKGLSLSSDMPALHYTLGKARKYKADDPDFTALVALADNADSKGHAILHQPLFRAVQGV